MIFYFSGTGNSAWVARQLAEGQNEELLSIAMEIDRNKAYKLKEGEKVGFVFPGQRNNLRDFIFKHII